VGENISWFVIFIAVVCAILGGLCGAYAGWRIHRPRIRRPIRGDLDQWLNSDELDIGEGQPGGLVPGQFIDTTLPDNPDIWRARTWPYGDDDRTDREGV
jgi:hypothetical protein